jgi:hypothetical protein
LGGFAEVCFGNKRVVRNAGAARNRNQEILQIIFENVI